MSTKKKKKLSNEKPVSFEDALKVMMSGKIKTNKSKEYKNEVSRPTKN